MILFSCCSSIDRSESLLSKLLLRKAISFLVVQILELVGILKKNSFTSKLLILKTLDSVDNNFCGQIKLIFIQKTCQNLFGVRVIYVFRKFKSTVVTLLNKIPVDAKIIFENNLIQLTILCLI